jgi:hypothetical protein
VLRTSGISRQRGSAQGIFLERKDVFLTLEEATR